jgi:hypothetical protein
MYARAGNILLSLLGACVFWLYAFALRRISRLVSRLRGDFLLVE